VTPLIVNSRLMVSACRRGRQQGGPRSHKDQALANLPAMRSERRACARATRRTSLRYGQKRAGRAAVPAPGHSLRRIERSPAAQPTFRSRISPATLLQRRPSSRLGPLARRHGDLLDRHPVLRSLLDGLGHQRVRHVAIALLGLDHDQLAVVGGPYRLGLPNDLVVMFPTGGGRRVR